MNKKSSQNIKYTKQQKQNELFYYGCILCEMITRAEIELNKSEWKTVNIKELIAIKNKWINKYWDYK